MAPPEMGKSTGTSNGLTINNTNPRAGVVIGEQPLAAGGTTRLPHIGCQHCLHTKCS